MTTPDSLLRSRAQRQVPVSPEVRDCWRLVVRGIELGWLERGELRELIAHLRSNRDFGVEELQFEHVGDRLRVSFLDEVVKCPPAAMLQELAALVT